MTSQPTTTTATFGLHLRLRLLIPILALLILAGGAVAVARWDSSTAPEPAPRVIDQRQLPAQGGRGHIDLPELPGVRTGPIYPASREGVRGHVDQ